MTGNFYENSGVPVDIELDYPEDRQAFFRQVMQDPEGDVTRTLEGIR